MAANEGERTPEAQGDTAVSEQEERPDFPIVGIGASAGGLLALETFFDHLPDESGMAFVVVQHLSPEHESQLAQILQSHTGMEVQQVKDALRVKPDHVYVIPPGKDLSIMDGRLHLSEPEEPRRHRAPIDLFFRTLAETHEQRAIGIILSGTGSGGTQGIKRIKECGGVTMAQDPDEAEHGGMVRSAIATNLVDVVLPVAELAEKVLELKDSADQIHLPEEAEALEEDGSDALNKIFAQLRVRTRHDFTHHKRSSVLRRIRRRMQIKHVEDLPTYLAFLRRHPDEVQALFADLLISVTNFFRDKEAFEALEQEVIPALFQGKAASDQVRIWVAGCATAEEAYSVAMLLREYATEHLDGPDLQVFATDIDEEAVSFARNGLYPESIEADISEERLKRFFSKASSGYRIAGEIRDMVLFATHDLLNDPPFSKLDLITCRNLLIYLKRDVQERIFELFHYALRPGGYLFLGASETADGAPNLYATVNKKYRIFQRRAASSAHVQVPTLPVMGAPPVAPTQVQKEEEESFSFGVLHQKLLELYAPPSAVVNEHYDFVHLSESVGRYLRFPGGEPSQNILEVVHPGLQLELRTTLYRAFQSGQPAESGRVRVSLEGETRWVRLVVRPGEDMAGAQGFMLVIFDDREGETSVEEGTTQEAKPLVEQLQQELQDARERLQVTIEEYETSNEEMKASNEELQSMNEELKSATEELETSKEELQSMNEELATVNQELQNKNQELSRANDDLRNLMTSTNIGTFFLDRNLRLKRYTSTVERLFNIIPSDVGRPFSHITHRIAYDGLVEDAEEVLHTLTPVEREICTEDGEEEWFLVRLRPYRTAEDKIDGVVITFVDITGRKQTEEALRRSDERYRLLLENMEEYAIITLDTGGRITSWEAGAGNVLGYEEDEVLGRSGAIIFTKEDRETGTFEKEMETARTEGQASDERWQLRKDGRRFWASGILTALRTPEGALRGFAKVLRDLTHRKRLEEDLEQRVEERTAELRASEMHYRTMLEAIPDLVFQLSLDGVIEDAHTPKESKLPLPAEAMIGRPAHEVLPKGVAERLQPAIEQVLETGEDALATFTLRMADGGKYEYEARIMPLDGSVLVIKRDITERRRLERDILKAAEQEQRRIGQDLHDELGQQLVGASYLSQSLQRRLEEEGSVHAEEMGEIAGHLASALDYTRNLSHMLSAADIDGEGLDAALRRLAERIGETFDVACRYESEGPNIPQDQTIVTHLFRIMREAVTNAVRHGAPDKVTIRRVADEEGLLLRVEDDGTGISEDVLDDENGLGLRSMRYRADLIGARLDVEPRASGGTIVTCTWTR